MQIEISFTEFEYYPQLRVLRLGKLNVKYCFFFIFNLLENCIFIFKLE